MGRPPPAPDPEESEEREADRQWWASLIPPTWELAAHDGREWAVARERQGRRVATLDGLFMRQLARVHERAVERAAEAQRARLIAELQAGPGPAP